MAGPIDAITASVQSKMQWIAQDNITGLQPIVSNLDILQTKTFQVGTSTVERINQIYATLLTISASGSTTIDLTSFTNVVNLTASFARVKAIRIRLLSTAQTSADGTTTGTACTSIIVGNNAANDFTSQAGGLGWFGSATSNMILPNGASMLFETSNDVGVVVDATHKIIKIANSDAANSAKVEVVIFGADA